MKLQLQQNQIQPAMKKACVILDRLLQAGFSAFFVGGAVRDTLLERPLHDIDIATNARPEQVMALFSSCIPTGLQHGTVTVVEGGVTYEVTTFRTESNYADYRRPTDVTFVNDLYEDLKRRDFTMNAMAIDRNWQLVDHFDGLAHVKSGVLKTVGSSNERFQEDALRMLRAVRFAAVYKLTIDQNCWQSIVQEASLLKHIAMERIASEIDRLLQSCNPMYGIQLLIDSTLLKHTKAKLHLRESTLHTEYLFPEDRQAVVGWVLFFSSLAISSEQARADLRALRSSKQLQISCQAVLELHEWLQRINLHTMDKRMDTVLLKEQWLHKLLQYSSEHITLFFQAYQQQYSTIGILKKLHEELPIHRVKQLAVRGDQLMKWLNKSSGPWINEMLEQIFIEVASCRLCNSKQAIYDYVNNQVEGGRYHE